MAVFRAAKGPEEECDDPVGPKLVFDARGRPHLRASEPRRDLPLGEHGGAAAVFHDVGTQMAPGATRASESPGCKVSYIHLESVAPSKLQAVSYIVPGS